MLSGEENLQSTHNSIGDKKVFFHAKKFGSIFEKSLSLILRGLQRTVFDYDLSMPS